jgi:hypothetical protein
MVGSANVRSELVSNDQRGDMARARIFLASKLKTLKTWQKTIQLKKQVTKEGGEIPAT